MRKILMAAAAFSAAVVVLVAASLPPAQLALEPSADGTISGIIHVHTNRSDGRSGPEEIAAAAARAGLKFVVLTDHGDATRPPDAAVYRSGVLCIDAVEVSTSGGHYLALDMPPAPYPLGGDARGVVEDVKRLGGFGVVAHPNSPKLDLSWDEWDAPFDAVEWLNPDTSWRLKVRPPGWRARWNILAALTGYVFRSPEAIARVMAGTDLDASRWDSFAHERRVVVLAGADAHARLALTSAEPRNRELSLPLPGYEASFRTLSLHVRPERPLSGDAARDATTIVQALRRGHVYVAVDGMASPPSFQFTAGNATGTVGEGDVLEEGGPVSLRVRSNAPSSFRTTIFRNGTVLTAEYDHGDLTRSVPADPAVYRVVIEAPSRFGPASWIVSNPIYVGQISPRPQLPPAVVSESHSIFDGRSALGWRTEANATSAATLDVTGTDDDGALRMRYRLSEINPPGPYAALAVELPDGAGPYDRVTFTAGSNRPLRIEVQFQPLGRAEGWQRSVYLDETNREHTIRFDEAVSITGAGALHPTASQIHDILFVIDATHAKPGTSGQLRMTSVALAR